ncbi:MAG TPA: 50S ribosomal protein L20 [Candidatus Paceibacterota bacterium]|nr:50S ribosomal protein L20 [Candidatus Paceibacterota bacterium]
MTRVKGGVMSKKRKKKVIKYTKGFKYGRKSKYRQANEALVHSWSHAFKDRKRKKREKRNLWTVKINAASRETGLTYNQFISKLKQQNIILDRKILAELAEKHPHIFKEITTAIIK